MPEQHNIEWKSTWKDEYLKWICGFANAQGGWICNSGNFGSRLEMSHPETPRHMHQRYWTVVRDDKLNGL